MKVASELAGTILKVVVNRFGQAICCECGSAHIEELSGKYHVWAMVLADGYLHPQCVRIHDSDEFAQSAVREINYPVSLLEAL